jgi:hypothetical protein
MAIFAILYFAMLFYWTFSIHKINIESDRKNKQIEQLKQQLKRRRDGK